MTRRFLTAAALAIFPAVFLLLLLTAAQQARAQAWGLPAMSAETKACVECHKTENAGIYQQWGASKHYRANVGCYECHAAKEGKPGAYKHEGVWIATIVSPKDCRAATPRRATSSPIRTTPRPPGSSVRRTTSWPKWSKGTGE